MAIRLRPGSLESGPFAQATAVGPQVTVLSSEKRHFQTFKHGFWNGRSCHARCHCPECSSRETRDPDVVTAAQRSAFSYRADVSAGRLEGLKGVRSSHAYGSAVHHTRTLAFDSELDLWLCARLGHSATVAGITEAEVGSGRVARSRSATPDLQLRPCIRSRAGLAYRSSATDAAPKRMTCEGATHGNDRP